MKRNTRTIFFIIWSIATLVVGVYAYGVYYVQGLVQKTSTLKEQMVDLTSKYQHLQVLHSAIVSAGGEKNKIGQYFIPAGGAVDFVTQFEQLAGSVGLTFNTLSIDAASTPDLEPQGKELLHISFETNGTWSKNMYFLSLVESLPYSTHIENITFDTTAGTPSLVGSDSGSAKIVGDIPQVGSRQWRMVLSLQVVKIKDDAR